MSVTKTIYFIVLSTIIFTRILSVHSVAACTMYMHGEPKTRLAVFCTTCIAQWSSKLHEQCGNLSDHQLYRRFGANRLTTSKKCVTRFINGNVQVVILAGHLTS